MDGNNTFSTNVPPHTNRGVQNSWREGLEACVDWFSCTFHEVDSVRSVLRVLGFQSHEFAFKDLPKGLYGYRNQISFNGIKILYNGKENMGIHVEMSGRACRTFEKYSNLTWEDLFRRLTINNKFEPKIKYPHEKNETMKLVETTNVDIYKRLKAEKEYKQYERIPVEEYKGFIANITRLDLALDDFKGYFKIPNLIKYLKDGNVTSLFKIAKRINNIVIKTGEEVGHTLYFGRPDSMIQVRFYEKNIEQLMKGKEVPENCTIWNRTEIQARDDRAQAFASLIATSTIPLGAIIAGTLKNYITFRRKGYIKGKKSVDVNKSRWDVAIFWRAFLKDAEKIKLTQGKELPTIERKYSWVDKSVSKTLAMLAFAFPEDADYMIDTFLKEGYEKIEDDDWDLINDFRENKTTLDELISNVKKSHANA